MRTYIILENGKTYSTAWHKNENKYYLSIERVEILFGYKAVKVWVE